MIKKKKKKKKQIIMVHVGRKAPKGWKELAGGIHLGKGIWMMRVVKDI